ncbi:hypothetical protein [Ideonella margarita]|uniref:Uncharacterized protein n=1 Tax=Ideonella margarita TaxID=2984191 RepID=A0ABU9C7R8_9BURK
MTVSFAIAVSLAFASGAASAVEQRKVVPAAFVGEWNFEPALCGSQDGEGRLVIHTDHVEFYESAGPVLQVLVESPVQIFVIAQLQGEGQVWRSVRRWHLSADGRQLTDEPGAGAWVRHRCPKPGAL